VLTRSTLRMFSTQMAGVSVTGFSQHLVPPVLPLLLILSSPEGQSFHLARLYVGRLLRVNPHRDIPERTCVEADAT
jgi:hypothetical protein